MNNALNISQEENNKIRKQVEIYQMTIQVNHRQFTELKETLKAREIQIDDIQEEFKKKVGALHQSTDKFNVAQLKCFTLRQEFESLKGCTEREITRLKDTLVTMSAQNRSLLQEKGEREQKYEHLSEELSK